MPVIKSVFYISVESIYVNKGSIYLYDIINIILDITVYKICNHNKS